jgi:membrane fusion protein
MIASLQLEENTLRARLAAFDESAPMTTVSASADIAALMAERDAASAAIVSNQSRLVIAQDRLRAGESLLPKGLIAAEEVRRRQEAVLAADQAIADARAREASLNARIARTRNERAKLPFDAAMTRAQLEAQIVSLSQRRVQAETSRGYEIRAQVSGRVSALQAPIGQALDPQRPLMTITPSDARLVAELYVPSRGIGFIQRGQHVRLLYDAFPYQRFGPARGAVEAISATVLAPAEVQAVIPIEEPVYRVVVTLDRQAMHAFGRDAPLHAGMALTADIILERRTFAEWLFEPLFAMRGRM